jgi:16S rRNA (uracil1498-N3)-methyltransferase
MGERDGDGGIPTMKEPPWLLVASGNLDVGRTVVLDPSEARHLTGALRRRPGDEVVLADGEGWVADARLITIIRGRVEAEVMSAHREPEPESDGVTVALAVIDSRAMDWAVQKAVEIGAQRFVPVETGRAQFRGRDLGSRVEHWRRISMQALKQCRRPWAMEVTEVLPLAALVDSESATGGGVVADFEGSAIGTLSENAGNLLIVGPEGGFTTDENGLFDLHGWPRLRMGPHILRAETAAVVGGAMMVARMNR